ncbi:MAG: tyrosine-protein phosphatase, partial [Bacilli bacterium]|nr:tyrosine-protein phosphatase [Bacilli bacterium]
MKKSNFAVLSIAALLVLTACGPNANNPASSNASGVLPGSSAPDGQDTTGFAFNEINDTVMVEERVKSYVDAMKEQEKTLQYEYRISPLYGPEDFGANLPDKGDSFSDYASEEKGGVDVQDYLNRNLYNGDCPCKPIQIKWTKGKLKYGTATIEYWPKGKAETEKKSITTKGSSVNLENLYRNTEYEFVLKTDTVEWTSPVQSFKTADYTRMINMGGVHNVRDLGGYMTSYGKRTKQGLIYRGYEVMKKAVGQHSANYSEEVQKVQDEVLHIGHEIDLKGASDIDYTTVDGVKVSNLSPAKYTNLEAVAYDKFITDTTKYSHTKDTFDILAKADEEHVYFHCWGGADRTGMIAFFLNAILGVSYTDLVMDFEYTTLTNNKRSHMHNSDNAHFPKFLDAFTKWSGYEADKTINYNCAKFLTDACGVTNETIEKIRSIMIEDYSSSLTENENLETYDTSKWEMDDEGHWHKSTKANSPKKGDYRKHQWVIDQTASTPATCEHDGKEVKVCSECGKRVETILPKGDHNFVAHGEANGVVHPEKCEFCDDLAYRLDISEATGWNNATTKWNAKTTTSNNNAVEASWDISGGKIPAGNYSVYIECYMSNASHTNRYFFNQNKSVNAKNPATGEDFPDDPASSGNEDKDTESKWRYYVSLNGGAMIEPDPGKSWGDLGLE